MNILICFLLLVTSLLMLSSALGLWRFSDTMSRLHATGKIGSLAVIMMLSVNLVDDLSFYNLVKTLLLILLVYFTTAHTTHIISNSLLKSKTSSLP
jgi:monovalent cation/proton antiporter MnhG/PhaG subunit